MAAYPKITSIPPLRQLSVLPVEQKDVRDQKKHIVLPVMLTYLCIQASFVLNIEWSTARPKFLFQIELCYSEVTSRQHVSLWPSISLNQASSQPINLQQDENQYTACFVGKLPYSSLPPEKKFQHLVFTFKYRIEDHAPWQWFQDSGGIEKGEIIFQAPVADSPPVSSLIALEPGWEAMAAPTSVSGATLFSIVSNGPISRGQGAEGPLWKSLGLVQIQARYVAFAQLEPPWIGPRHGDDFLYLAEGAVLCSVLRKDGIVVTIAAPSIGNIRALLHSDEHGRIVVEAQDDGNTGAPFRIMLSVARDMENSLEAIMCHFREESNDSQLIQDIVRETTKSHDTSPESYEKWLDGLVFCTWNGLGPDLTEGKVLQALEVLEDHGVSISTLLIDDNWQTLAPTELDFGNPFWRGFADFKPTEGFPNGLDGMIRRVKKEHPLISDIGVWHALFGYWGGLAKEGWIVDNYETFDVDGKLYYAVPTKIKSITAKDLDKFYDDFYTYLASQGVTFVKADVQCSVTDLKHSDDRTILIPAYQRAWMTAQLRHFQGKAISCMAQVPEMLWRILLQDKFQPVVLRNSDDFFPEIPASHSWHLWANAHNALFTQHLNAVLDWDMFQTSHEYGAYHAAARCLSGGPISITDIPGKHDLDVINQMVAPSPDGGRSIALRPSVGKTPRVFDRYLESGVLKIVSETTLGTKLMGLFNTGEAPISLLIEAAEFAAVGRELWPPGSEVLFFSHRAQAPYGPLFLKHIPQFYSHPEDLIHAKLPVKGFEILSGHVTNRLPYKGGHLLVCVLGLLGKMTGAAAVCSSVIKISDEKKLYMSIQLKALGLLGVWISGPRIEKSQILAKLENLELEGHMIKTFDFPDGARESQLVQFDILETWSKREHTGDSRMDVTLDIVIEMT